MLTLDCLHLRMFENTSSSENLKIIHVEAIVLYRVYWKYSVQLQYYCTGHLYIALFKFKLFDNSA